jgi:photosystem II stability/assembly factor-like uncharacterized protein
MQPVTFRSILSLRLPLVLAIVSSVVCAPGRAQTPESSLNYKWSNVKIVAGGFITGIVPHPKVPGLAYIRTDIGGAYRYDGYSDHSTPLTDIFNQNDWNLTGTESLAVDPVDPGRLYLAQGEYTESWAPNGAILRSTDYGAHFDRIPLPIQLGSNEPGRYSGERLTVDPLHHNILFFGTRNNGLWKSSDFGSTWAQVATFPVTGPTAGVGVIFEDYLPNKKDPAKETILAGVSDNTIPALYSSTDGGVTWTAVPGQPTGLFPTNHKLGPDGSWYITYGDGTGASGMGGSSISTGAVWKYNTATGVWTNITPLGPWWNPTVYCGYGAVTVDPRHPNVVMVSTLDRWWPGDEVYRSLDGGATWKALGNEPDGSEPGPPYNYSVRNDALSPYLTGISNSSACTPSGCDLTQASFGWWIGALAIDPFDSDHVMYGTGATIWESHDVTNADSGGTSHWVVGANGIEETAVSALVSPPAGAHLISGLSDIGGFRHDNLDISPVGGMSQPYYTPLSIDFAQNLPSLVVRGPGWSQSAGAYSTDGGTTWTAFNGLSGGPRNIAVSADGNHWVLTQNSGTPYYSTDYGTNWTASTGAPANDAVLSDRVNPLKFYSYDSGSGTLYASVDGGATFTVAATGLPAGTLYVSPAGEGNLWLGTYGDLYHSTEAVAKFSKVGHVQQAFALGFGKPAPWSHHVTLFLSGEVGGVLGIFRSTDAGQTWVQINDAQHQWGSVSPVVGDPKVFGRVFIGTNGRGIIHGDIVSP